MRTFRRFLLQGFIFGCFSALPAHSGQSPFSIHIDAPASVKEGNDVLVEATLTNTSGVPLLATLTVEGGLDYDVKVLDSSGNKVVETDYGRGMKSHLSRALNSGESLSEEIIVNKFFDMTHPGEYSIQVTRQIPIVYSSNPSETEYTTILRSNTINVLVTN